MLVNVIEFYFTKGQTLTKRRLHICVLTQQIWKETFWMWSKFCDDFLKQSHIFKVPASILSTSTSSGFGSSVEHLLCLFSSFYFSANCLSLPFCFHFIPFSVAYIDLVFFLFVFDPKSLPEGIGLLVYTAGVLEMTSKAPQLTLTYPC